MRKAQEHMDYSNKLLDLAVFQFTSEVILAKEKGQGTYGEGPAQQLNIGIYRRQKTRMNSTLKGLI